MNSLINGTMVDDTAAEVSYFPADAWYTNRYGHIAHYNDTYHFTGVPGAYLTFRFNGSFVAYCSNLDTNHGVFFVSIDGRPVGKGDTYAQVTLPSRALFTVAVEPGPHVLNISNAATNTVMSLDYFITLSSPQPSHRTQVPPPVFHAVLGLLCGLVAAAVLGALLLCARTRRTRAQPPESDSTGPTGMPDPPPYPASIVYSRPLPASVSRAKGSTRPRVPLPDPTFDTAISVSL